MTGRFAFWLAAVAALFGAWLLPAAAQDAVWRVAKSSGEAWIGSASHPASITQQVQLRPGDSIRTGRNGRVLLVRGQETILVSPNSAISLPEAGRPGQSTVIQQAGTIMLDVEKRNVQHFEVETPYLAAVVKGTRFRVSVVGGQTKVDVVRGQVQVTDFRSGDHALVNPQQFARSSGGGASGLKVGGGGELGTVLRGPAQASRVPSLPIPAGGLKPDAGAVPVRSTQSTSAVLPAPSQPVIARTPGGGARIVAPIGELHLNIREVTKGMARNDGGDNAKNKNWTSRLQPGNGGNDIRSDNSGSAKPSGTGPSSESAGPSAAAAGESAAGSAIISNAVTNVGGVMGGGKGNGKGGGGKDSGGKSGGADDGPGGKSLGGPSGLGGQIAGGLDALIEKRGRGNAYGHNGGNGNGKAHGLGKKN